MKKLVKGFIITAIIMILVGISLFIGGILAAGGVAAVRYAFSEHNLDFEFDDIGGEEYRTFSKYDVENLVIEVEAASIVMNEKHGQDDLEVHTDNGRIEIEVEDETLYIKADSRADGNEIEVTYPVGFVFENVEISVGASEMNIQGLNANDFRAEIGAGEIIIQEANVKECSVDVGMGNFEYEGTISEDCDLDCGMGNMELYLEGDSTDFNYEVDCAAGNVSVGTESLSGIIGDSVIDNGADADMDIDCGMGNVTIVF